MCTTLLGEHSHFAPHDAVLRHTRLSHLHAFSGRGLLRLSFHGLGLSLLLRLLGLETRREDLTTDLPYLPLPSECTI